MKKRRVLVVEDDPPVRVMITAMLAQSGIDVVATENADAALRTLEDQDFDAVLSDVRMPGRSGIELVPQAIRLRPHTPVLLMTAYASLNSAVDAMRAGALDYIAKPIKREELLRALGRAFEQRDRDRTPATARPSQDDERRAFEGLVGSSPALREIFDRIRRIADRSSSVLITGESGTGKEEVARAIHLAGRRAKAPFVPINCTAIPAGLLESELFGHGRGAFTGAVESRRGLFEAASGGTLFLDEIGDMKLELQAKLLRVLEDREVRRVGETRSVQLDVRIIAASHRDLPAAMESGQFRHDLYYRLNVIPIHLPPLRERPEDVRALAEHFVAKLADGAPPVILPETMERLVALPWPGNVRQLANALERAVALGDGQVIRPEDLPDGDEPQAEPVDEEQATRDFVRKALSRGWTLRKIEDMVIAEALEAAKGNKSKTADLLGISRRTLYRRGDPAAQD
ncbi:MAG: sigma-54-dependent transcriptional regulator [Myxococcota bacterium]